MIRYRELGCAGRKMSSRKDKTLGLVKTTRSASKTMSSVAAATKRPRPKRRLRDAKDAKPCTATKSTGELFEGVFLPLSMGGRPRNLERVQMAAPLKIVDSDHPIKLKYEGAAREPWDRLDDTDEWSIKAQLLLREDYLARLRKMSLPLASSPSQDQDEVDVNNLLQLADLLRNVTVSAVNNICDANLEKGSRSSKSRREPFLWNGRNILLELPSDLDFAARLPRLAEILDVDSLHRNPFLERKSLPLPDTAEGRAILRPLLDMESESSIQRARRAILEEEHRHGVRRVKGPFVRWKELEDLREQVKNKEQEDEMLSREMMPKLAKVTVCQHNVHCFRRQDADGDGLLTYKEFLRGLKLLLLPFSIDSHEHVNWILEQVDPQRAGCVSYTAFNMLCENAKKCHSKRRTRWRRLTNNEIEPPPATTEEQKDCAEKLVLEKAERDNDKEVVFQDEIMEEKQGDEPAWLVEFNGVARKLGRTRKRIQTLLDDRLNLETEFKAFHAQTPSSPRVAKTAHFEYTESNAKRHEAILKSLKDSIREADSAIGCLREQELALVASLRVLKEQAMRNREILQNQHEELEMARQETRERDQCNKEAKRKRAEERARIKAEEAKYRTEQRDLRRKALKEKLRQEHSAATLIANSFRSWQARLRLAWFAESADEALCDIRSSQLFDTREKRLLERPTPLLVLGVGSRGKSVESFLRRSMPGNFWAFIPPVDAPDVANIGEVMQWWLDRAAALYWELPHNLTQDIAAALLITLETVRPRPLVIYLGDSGRHGDPHARWIFGALRHANALALESSGEQLTTASMQALVDAAAQILPSENLHSADDLVPTEKTKNGQQAPVCAEVSLLAGVVRACKKSTICPQRMQRNRFTAEFVNQNVSWPQVRFIDNTAAAAVRAFVETSAGISTPSLLRELIDVNLSDKSNRDCEDMIIHFALRELRVFQGATAMGDDMGTTLFRYGPRQVLVRTVPRGDHAVYRILDARGLAIRLAHCSGTLRSRLERMRAGKRERTLCNITSKGNESRGSRPVDETVVRLHAASRLIENVDGSLVLYKGCPGGYVCWLHWSETKPGRAQVKMVNSTPPFQELRGTIAVDTAKSGDELRRYLLHAVGRLRANPLTGLVSLAQ